MRNENEIRKRIEELIEYRDFLYEDFAPDYQIDVVIAEIDTLIWVLKD